jgi:2-iminoacetate synthase ThiH
MTSSLTGIEEKIAAGERLDETDARRLLEATDLLELGGLADAVRRRLGDEVTFVRVADLPLDACGDRPSPPPSNAGEWRLVGTMPDLAAACRAVKAAASVARGVPLSGFSLADLEELAGGSQTALTEVLITLREAGLELVAEAPWDRLHDAASALEAASGAAVPVARLTVHHPVPNPLDLLRTLAALSDIARPMPPFAPLPRMLAAAAPPTGYDDVRQVAMARLLLPGVERIQVDWHLYGPKLAQVALAFGANDLDAVSAYDPLDLGRRRAAVEEVRRNIQAALLIPVERNARFERAGP